MAPFADLGMATGVGDFLVVRFLVAVFAVAVELAAALAIVVEVDLRCV